MVSFGFPRSPIEPLHKAPHLNGAACTVVSVYLPTGIRGKWICAFVNR
jgi:hypothetical protein